MMIIRTHLNRILFVLSGILLLASCRKDPVQPVLVEQPYVVNVPQGFPAMPIPADNEFTAAGIELGRHLFYEEKLSGDNTQACASCHFQEYAFSDTTAFSIGIDGMPGKRNAMPIFNLAWSPTLFWDGRANSLEHQSLFPVIDPLEMHDTWPNAVAKLQADPMYVQMFEDAFGSPGIDSVRASKALGQFMRSIVSGNSPFDRYVNSGFDLAELGPNALDIFQGWQVFRDENKGDCIHCHLDPADIPINTDFTFRNNGLDMTPADSGRAAVPGANPYWDFGKFKVPSLRNLVYTAPYMHDGRFQTIDEVIDFYADDVQNPYNLAPELYYNDSSAGGGQGAILSPIERYYLKQFLLSLTDTSLTTNPAYSDPNP